MSETSRISRVRAPTLRLPARRTARPRWSPSSGRPRLRDSRVSVWPTRSAPRALDRFRSAARSGGQQCHRAPRPRSAAPTCTSPSRDSPKNDPDGRAFWSRFALSSARAPSDGVGRIGFGNPDPIRGRPTSAAKITASASHPFPFPALISCHINDLASKMAEFWEGPAHCPFLHGTGNRCVGTHASVKSAVAPAISTASKDGRRPDPRGTAIVDPKSRDILPLEDRQ